MDEEKDMPQEGNVMVEDLKKNIILINLLKIYASYGTGKMV